MGMNKDTNIYTMNFRSETRPGVQHSMLVKATCTCEAFVNRGTCRHVKKIYDAAEMIDEGIDHNVVEVPRG